MIAFAGIDGTGAWNNASYAATFQNSFVRRLSTSWPFVGYSFYNRGPDNPGLWTRKYASNAFYYIKDAVRNRDAKGVFLAGYSRGAAAVIEVASWLSREGIEVDGMLLFDAVDRSFMIGNGFEFDSSQAVATKSLLVTAASGVNTNTRIPATVRRVIHAKRNLVTSGSRESFGTWGGAAHYDGSPSGYLEKSFNGTHGAIGGTPWEEFGSELIDEGAPDGLTNITGDRDVEVAKEVWDWAKPKFDRTVRACRIKHNVTGARCRVQTRAQIKNWKPTMRL